MIRVLLPVFFFILSSFSWGQESVFQGRVDFGRDLASFEKSPPVAGSLYVFTGAASAVRILSQEPFVAEVDFVQGEWKDEANLVAHRTVLRFEGPHWAKVVVAKRPREGGDLLIYPYRKFQVAAVVGTGGFRVLFVPLLF